MQLDEDQRGGLLHLMQPPSSKCRGRRSPDPEVASQSPHGKAKLACLIPIKVETPQLGRLFQLEPTRVEALCAVVDVVAAVCSSRRRRWQKVTPVVVVVDVVFIFLRRK